MLVFWGEKEEVAWLEVISRTLEKLGLGDRKCRETLQSGPSGGERGRKDNLSYDGSESDGIISPNSFAMASLEASERLAEAVNLEITVRLGCQLCHSKDGVLHSCHFFTSLLLT